MEKPYSKPHWLMSLQTVWWYVCVSDEMILSNSSTKRADEQTSTELSTPGVSESYHLSPCSQKIK